jgi:hypothetical protein
MGRTTAQVNRAVQVRRPFSSLITISKLDIVRPRCSGVHTPVTSPWEAERWCVQLSSTPTAMLSGPAYKAAASEPSVSARTADAPPCSKP